MAKQQNGFLDGFCGTLGPAIGYMWKGKWCLRSRPGRVRNPRTAAQQANRQLFRQVVQQAASMRWAVLEGLTTAADALQMTAYNLFTRLNKSCFTFSEEETVVDYASLRLSAGDLAAVRCTTAIRTAEGAVEVHFESDRDNPLRSAEDRVLLYAYAPALGRGVMAAQGYRRQGSVGMQLPAAFVAEEVHFYLFARAADGTASECCYCGMLSVEREEDNVAGTSSDAGLAVPTGAPLVAEAVEGCGAAREEEVAGAAFVSDSAHKELLRE